MKLHSLLYHDVIDPACSHQSGFKGAGADVYKISPRDFRMHLEAISNLGTSAPTVEFENLPQTGWSITFDDGGESLLRAAQILEEFGWRGIFFISTDYVDTPGFLTSEQIREMDRNGHVIGSHSCSHPLRISSLSVSQIGGEWRQSREFLSDLLGKPVRVASVPGGFYSKEVAVSAADAGIEILFTSEPESVPRIAHGLLLLGRYGIQRNTTAHTARSLVSQTSYERWKQYIHWNMKKLLKSTLGSRYLSLRESLLSRQESYSEPRK